MDFKGNNPPRFAALQSNTNRFKQRGQSSSSFRSSSSPSQDGQRSNFLRRNNSNTRNNYVPPHRRNQSPGNRNRFNNSKRLPSFNIKEENFPQLGQATSEPPSPTQGLNYKDAINQQTKKPTTIKFRRIKAGWIRGIQDKKGKIRWQRGPPTKKYDRLKEILQENRYLRSLRWCQQRDTQMQEIANICICKNLNMEQEDDDTLGDMGLFSDGTSEEDSGEEEINPELGRAKHAGWTA